MKILLTAINAKYIHSNLAVYSLQAYAEAQGHKIERAEYTINNQLDDILEKIYCQKPDVLIFSCYIWNIEYVSCGRRCQSGLVVLRFRLRRNVF